MSPENASPCQKIIENQPGYIDSLYSSCFEKVQQFILNNSGTKDDAHDIFQEAIIILFQNCKKTNFVLSAAPCQFILGVAYNKWLSELSRRRKALKVKPEPGTANISFADDPQMQRERLVAKYFSLLEDNCRKMLQWSVIEKLPGKEVAEKLNITYQYFRTAKKRCLDNFFKRLEDDDQWKELKN